MVDGARLLALRVRVPITCCFSSSTPVPASPRDSTGVLETFWRRAPAHLAELHGPMSRVSFLWRAVESRGAACNIRTGLRLAQCGADRRLRRNELFLSKPQSGIGW